MLLKYSLLLLGLVAGFQGHEICNFEKHLCKWTNMYRCHFIHETSKPLAGETGYLYLSKDTCHKAGIKFSVERYRHSFQLHYFINGTGSATLAVGADYGWLGGRENIWYCQINHGPRWYKADIHMFNRGTFVGWKYITIEAYVHGDMTIAIGNITPRYSGKPRRSCPRPQVTNKPTTPKTTTIKSTTNSPETTTIPQTTSSPSTAVELTSDQSGQKDTTEIPAVTVPAVTVPAVTIPAVTVTARNDPNPTTTTGPQQSTLLQDVTTPGSASGGIAEAISSRSKQGATIGGSVFAAVFVIIAVVIAAFLYRRKKQMWDVQKSTSTGIENPLYQ